MMAVVLAAVFGHINVRVAVVRLLVYGLSIAGVVYILPGIDADDDLKAFGFLWAAVLYGLLSAYVRPLLDIWLSQFIVQTYGLVLVAINFVLFALLAAFSGFIEVRNVIAVLVGGVLLGLFVFVFDGILGLTPPVIDQPRTPGPPTRRPLGAELDERMRQVRVYQTVFWHLMDMAYGGLGELGTFRRWMQRRLWRPEVELRRLPPPVQFRLLLEQLGPTYVKIGQLISSQARTLPTEWEVELAKLQSNVQPFPVEQVREVIERELGAPPEQLYAWFDPEPLAAASLAQVHRATLADGRQVVAKVQRPGIHRQLRADVRILVRIADALSQRAGWATDIDLAGIVREFGTTLLTELDYTIEAYNGRRLGEVLAPIDGVHVPDIEYSLSSSRVLTQEFIDGVRPDDAAAIDAAGLDRELMATHLVQAATKMLLIDGFFHADPHPGNVLIETSGRVTLLDVGLVGEFGLRERISLGALMYATERRDVGGLAQTMRSLSTQFRDDVSPAAFDRDFERRMTPYLDPPPGMPVDSANVMARSLDLLIKHGYRMDADLTLGVKALMQAQEITRTLVPEWTGSEFSEIAIEAVQELLPDALNIETVSEAAARQAGYLAREAAQRLPSIQEGALRWLTHLERGRLSVEVDTSGLERQLDSLQSTARLFIAGLILAGLAIGSALAAGIEQTDGGRLSQLTDFALVLFTIAAIAGAIAVVGLAYRVIWPKGRRRRDPLA